MPRREHLFLTGASGFVGSAALRYVLRETNWHVTCPVSMRHKGEQFRVSSVVEENRDRISVVNCDLAMPFNRSLFQYELSRWGRIDYIWNIASESHVDRSLIDPVPFVRNNVDLILNTLEFARDASHSGLKLFLQMSTDEVFGPADEAGHGHHEWSPIKPSNPYSASKAAQEAITYSYWRAFGVPAAITNTMNLIGPAQSPEKFVPKTVRSILHGEEVTIHTTPDGESGSRCWIDVDQFADAWRFLTKVLTQDQDSLTYYPHMPDALQRYNVVGEFATNLFVAELLGDILGKEPKIKLVNFHQSRPGHDPHYALDGHKLRDLGWEPQLDLYSSLQKIVAWYLENPEFLEV